MKNFVRIYLDKKSNLFFSEESDEGLGLIGSFLTDDVGGSPEHWLKWFYDNRYDETQSNSTWVEKDNGYVLIGDLHSDDFEPHIRVPFSFLKKVLALWKECIDRKRDELTIEVENGLFRVF